jgi:hypothetical protein
MPGGYPLRLKESDWLFFSWDLSKYTISGYFLSSALPSRQISSIKILKNVNTKSAIL